jgi:hypothetical protein
MAKHKGTNMKTFILLDRSGSMATAWAETLSALNAFAADISTDRPKDKITVAAFDGGGFDLVRDKVKAADWPAITEKEVYPRGMTPLLDAIGRLDATIGSAKKAAILILTDGGENGSREVDRKAAKAITEKWDKAGYDVTYIGADFDAFGEASSLGIGSGKTLNASKAKIGATMAQYATRTRAYAKSGDNTADWSEDARKAAK